MHLSLKYERRALRVSADLAGDDQRNCCGASDIFSKEDFISAPRSKVGRAVLRRSYENAISKIHWFARPFNGSGR
jgi:hypothetical protein